MNSKKTFKDYIEIKKKGFTLIETMIALIIGSGLSVSLIKYQIDEVESSKTKILSTEIGKIISGVDKRISIDGYNINLWEKKSWEDHQIKDLIKKELQGTKSKCKTGEWIPRDNNLKLSLVDCDLFDKRIYDITITAQLKEENGYITKFITDYGFNSVNSFNKNISTMKRAMLLAKTDTKRPITGEKIFQYVDELGNNISFNTCLNKKDKCSFRVMLDRQGGAEYLHVDGTNSMIGSKITFIESKGNEPLKCMRWDLNKSTNKWNLKNDETCGVGIYDKKTPIVIDTALNNGTFENVLLNKSCNMYDWTGSSLMMKDTNTPCGMTKDGSTIIQLIENIHSDKALIDIIYTNKVFSKEIDTTTLLSKLIISDNIKVKDITINNNATFENGITINNGNLNVLNGDIKSNRKIESATSAFSDSFIKNLSVTENLFLGKTNNENSYCSYNGSLSRDKDGKILNCVSNKWILVGGDSTPIGTISMWGSDTTIPKGWVEMRGQLTTDMPKLRAIIGSKIPDMRNVFARGWSHDKSGTTRRQIGSYQSDADQRFQGEFMSIDRGRGYRDEHEVFKTVNRWSTHIRGGNGDSWGTYVSIDNSRTTRTSDESRPENIALMYIIKAY